MTQKRRPVKVILNRERISQIDKEHRILCIDINWSDLPAGCEAHSREGDTSTVFDRICSDNVTNCCQIDALRNSVKAALNQLVAGRCSFPLLIIVTDSLTDTDIRLKHDWASLVMELIGMEMITKSKMKYPD